MAKPTPQPVQPKKCAYCGNDIPRRTFPSGRSDSPSMYTERLYCNRVCQGHGQRSKTPSRSSRHRRAQQFLGSKCETCETTMDLLVHHKDRNNTNNAPENLMTLCRSCHTRWHWERGHLDPAKNNWFGNRADSSTRPTGRLNPDWVEVLMGYPIGWSRVSDESASRLSETAWSRKSRKSSGERSSRRGQKDSADA